MKKRVCIIYNFAQQYREGIFRLLDKEFDCDWFFGNNITVATYATNNILDVSWGGIIYRYDVSDIHSGAYSSFDTGKTACDVIKAPFDVSVINRIVENNNYILLQVGTRIIIMEKDKYLNKDFTIFVASVPSTDSEHSLIDIEIV